MSSLVFNTSAKVKFLQKENSSLRLASSYNSPFINAIIENLMDMEANQTS